MTGRIKKHQISLPFFNHFSVRLRAVNVTVIHDDDQVWSWEWCHMIQQTINKVLEPFCSKRTFDNFHGENAVQGEGRQYRKPMRQSVIDFKAQVFENTFFHRERQIFYEPAHHTVNIHNGGEFINQMMIRQQRQAAQAGTWCLYEPGIVNRPLCSA